MAATRVLIGIEAPYYQPLPLNQANFSIDFAKRGGKLFVAPSYGQYIDEARNAARRARFEAGMPMIGLTGHSPGVLYAIGAGNIGAPWIIGNFPGYSGSNKLVFEILKTVSCAELSQAWLLTEPEGPVRIPPDVLSVYGASYLTDFELAGTFTTAVGVGGFGAPQTQTIMRPTRSAQAAFRVCAATRSIGK